MKNKLICILMMMVLTVQTSLLGQNINKSGFLLNNTLLYVLNPDKFGLITDFKYQIPLLQQSGVLWENTKIDLGVRNIVSPADNYTAFTFFIRPIAIFEFTAEVGYHHMYTNLGYGVIPFSSGDMTKEDSSLEARTNIHSQGKNDNGGGLRLFLTPVLQMQVGPVALQNTFTFSYNDYPSLESDYFYEYYSDTIHKKVDSYIANSANVLYFIGKTGLGVGINYYFLHVLSSKYEQHRLAGLFLYNLNPKKGITSHSFALQAGTHLEDVNYKNTLYFLFAYTLKLSFIK